MCCRFCYYILNIFFFNFSFEPANGDISKTLSGRFRSIARHATSLCNSSAIVLIETQQDTTLVKEYDLMTIAMKYSRSEE